MAKSWDRDQTKATVRRTAEVLWKEREVFRVTERRRWRRRFILATVGAFLLGALTGGVVSRLHVSLDTAAPAGVVFR